MWQINKYISIRCTNKNMALNNKLSQWQKYSYGCNEFIFNPLIHWWKMGPIAKQLHIFLYMMACKCPSSCIKYSY
ncbi:hypothetical protein EDD22DRAFT_782827 [Suillus occidentalis]|nr:hypothetical protein EDD22DRAFT_782827 [Suillus occidentalis]